jgi:hypothetical protein
MSQHSTTHSPLRELAKDIWIAERPQRFYGLEVGTRMTGRASIEHARLHATALRRPPN